MIHHVPLHVMCSHIFEDENLSETDQAHIVRCDLCLEAVIICLKSDSFASALRSFANPMRLLPAEPLSRR